MPIRWGVGIKAAAECSGICIKPWNKYFRTIPWTGYLRAIVLINSRISRWSSTNYNGQFWNLLSSKTFKPLSHLHVFQYILHVNGFHLHVILINFHVNDFKIHVNKIRFHTESSWLRVNELKLHVFGSCLYVNDLRIYAIWVHFHEINIHIQIFRFRLHEIWIGLHVIGFYLHGIGWNATFDFLSRKLFVALIIYANHWKVRK